MSAEQYLAMTFVQLKQECTKRGLDTNGSKDHLVKRLLGAGGGASSSPSPTSSSHAASTPTSPSTHSPAVAGAAAKFGGVHHASSGTHHAEPTQLKHSVSWKVHDDEKKASPAPAASPQSKFLQEAEKRKREIEAEQERQRQEDALSRFAAEREEKRKQEEAERQRRQAAEDDARHKQDAQDTERRRQEEERRRQQQDDDNRRRQQEEADRRRANEEQERRRQNEDVERRRQQEEAERRRQQEEQERRRQNEETERRRQQDEADRRRQREEEQRLAEIRTRQDADLKKAGDERVRAALAESQRLEVETAKAHEEAKRKAEQAKSVQDEARRKEEEARRLTEESRRLTEDAKNLYDTYRKLEEQSKAARRAVTEAQKKSEDDARKAAEANIIAARKAQAEENSRRAQQEREAEARRAQQEREAEATRKKTADEKRQRELQQEEERRRAAAEEEERRRKVVSPEPEKKRTIEIFESDSDEEDSNGKSNGTASKNNSPQDPALAALIAERNRARQGIARGGKSSPALSSPAPSHASSPQHVNSNPSTPSPEEQRRKLMASKPLPAAPKSAPVTPQEKESPPKLEVAVMTMGPDSDNEASDSSTPRGITPRGLRPFAKVAWYLRDWEWSSKDEVGQSEDEPPAVLNIKRDYQGDMFWLICDNSDDARKLTRHVPESQKMLESSSGFYDPYLDRASQNYSSMLMIQQGKKVFFLCSRDLSICVRKSCQYVENSLHEARYRGHGTALKNKMIDRLEELKDYYPSEDQDAMADAVDFEDRNSVSPGTHTPMQRGHSRNKSLGDKLTLTPEDKEAIKGMKDTAAKAVNQGMEKTKTGIKNIVASLK